MFAFTTAATTHSYNNNNMKDDKSYNDASTAATAVFEPLERLIVRVASACASALKTATSAVQTLLDAITAAFSTAAERSASTEYASESVVSSDNDDNADAMPILEDDGDYENELALPTQEAMEQADEEHDADVDNDFHFSENGDEDDDDAVPMLEDDSDYENESAFDLPMLEATECNDEEEDDVASEKDAEDDENVPMLEDNSDYENESAFDLPMLEATGFDDEEEHNVHCERDEDGEDMPMLGDDSEYEDKLAFPMLQVTQEDDDEDVGDDDASACEDRYAVPVSDDDVVSKLDGRTDIENDFASLMQEASRVEEEQDDAEAIFVDAATATVLPRVRRHISGPSAAQLYARKTRAYACRREMCAAAINRAR